jgi:3-dehydroquinate dehydratase/shikimate dehydrogenase
MPDDVVDFANSVAREFRGSVIATCRSLGQGGASDLPTDARAALLTGIPASYYDIEFDPASKSGADPVALAALGCNTSKIISYHDFRSILSEFPRLIGAMESHPCQPEVIKIAWTCNDICENLLALKLIAERPGKRILICMGERGLMSRILAAKVGAFGTFCAAAADRVVAPGQLSVVTMLERFRWASIDSNTRVFGVIGSPVAHSISPAVFNAQFSQQDYNGVYLPLLIESDDELTRFLEACRTAEWLDATGFSVTLPHKESVCRWLGDRADRAAQRIGAVNTLHLVDGDYRGFNTDYTGILDALREKAELGGTVLASKRAIVLGAGGAARAAVAALVDSGCEVTIFNRSADRASELAREFACNFGRWEERAADAPDLLINCTRVGMWPNVAESPMPAGSLRAKTVVFDTVYKPKQTALIQGAQAAGCKTIGGLEMFIHQAAAQYKIWTGAQADLSLLRQTAEIALDQDAPIATENQR